MSIENITIGELKAILPLVGGSSHSLVQIGTAVLIRTVTMYYTGRVKAVSASEIELDEAAWIADCGRFADALRTGTLKEVEPYPGCCIVSRGAIVDVSPWNHPLPREQK